MSWKINYLKDDGVGMYSALGGLLQALEYIAYGQAITSYEDTIVGIIVTFAVYKLFMNGISFE